jgi:hypothetical protein
MDITPATSPGQALVLCDVVHYSINIPIDTWPSQELVCVVWYSINKYETCHMAKLGAGSILCGKIFNQYPPPVT